MTVKLLHLLLLAIILCCGCRINSLPETSSTSASESDSKVAAAAINSNQQNKNIKYSLELMRRDLQIFLQAKEYEAALMQLKHYRKSVNLMPEPTAEALIFRDGELFYYEILCLIEIGEIDKARALLQGGLQYCPPIWQPRVRDLQDRLED